jgi:hypothetical protein
VGLSHDEGHRGLFSGKNQFEDGFFESHFREGQHLERISERERRLNRLLRELAPDLALFTGDFLSLSSVYDPKSWAHARAIVKDWQAPLGVYVAAGSPPVDLPEVLARLLKDMPNLRCLRGERVLRPVPQRR